MERFAARSVLGEPCGVLPMALSALSRCGGKPLSPVTYENAHGFMVGASGVPGAIPSTREDLDIRLSEPPASAHACS